MTFATIAIDRESSDPNIGVVIQSTNRTGVEVRARQALDRLAQACCWGCGAGLPQNACDDCGLCHCPLCGTEASTGCRHLLATAGSLRDGDERPFSGGACATLLIRSPFAARPMLHLPESTVGNPELDKRPEAPRTRHVLSRAVRLGAPSRPVARAQRCTAS